VALRVVPVALAGGEEAGNCGAYHGGVEVAVAIRLWPHLHLHVSAVRYARDACFAGRGRVASVLAAEVTWYA
jgi:hypothetical protein